MTIKRILLIGGLALIGGLVFYLFRPLSNAPAPASFDCLAMENGVFISKDSLPAPQRIYGMGLTYGKHLAETASEYNPDALPPIFKKELTSVTYNNATVRMPDMNEMVLGVQRLETEVATNLRMDYPELNPMLDYEVELGFVLLEDVETTDLAKEDFVPPLGFFIANDLSARSVALLGEGTNQRYEYWGVSKSFDGFMPMSNQIWIPNAPTSACIPCVKIETVVNGEVRQSQMTSDMIYTPLEMLRFIHQKYPNTPLQKGDLVLTGTPGGVAIATPRHLVRLSQLIGMDRYQKLSLKLDGDLTPFLKAGDKVEVKGEGFEGVSVVIE